MNSLKFVLIFVLLHFLFEFLPEIAHEFEWAWRSCCLLSYEV